jgi:hypothetical protein
MGPRTENIKGKRYGKLVVREFVEVRGGMAWWLCDCDCGKTTVAPTGRLNIGLTASCGCGMGYKTHGLSKLLAYKSWNQMMQRCYNEKHISYKNYGARGIKVCERWHDFPSFLADMGDRQPGWSIERRDISKDYQPDNCTWLENSKQARNKRNTIFVAPGKTLQDHCKETGEKYHTAYMRRKRLLND